MFSNWNLVNGPLVPIVTWWLDGSKKTIPVRLRRFERKWGYGKVLDSFTNLNRGCLWTSWYVLFACYVYPPHKRSTSLLLVWLSHLSHDLYMLLTSILPTLNCHSTVIPMWLVRYIVRSSIEAWWVSYPFPNFHSANPVHIHNWSGCNSWHRPRGFSPWVSCS